MYVCMYVCIRPGHDVKLPRELYTLAPRVGLCTAKGVLLRGLNETCLGPKMVQDKPSTFWVVTLYCQESVECDKLDSFGSRAAAR